MNKENKNISIRWGYMIIGVIAMLFAGVLYAWSILKAPLAVEFGWGASQLALNFTLAMTFFCVGGLLGARLSKRAGHKVALVTAGVLSAAGFVLTALLKNASVEILYVTYGVLAGLGIGIAYNVVIATVSIWFPDKKGLCSGCLMMGFGASTLLLGKIADLLFNSNVGWRKTFVAIGCCIAAVVVLSSLVIKAPDASVELPQKKKSARANQEDFELRDYTPAEMVRRFTFWRAFFALVCLTAAGSSVISFAKDLALSVGAQATLATTLVGVLAVCNGLGRIITGAVFDALGRRFTMISASILTIAATGITLLAVSISSLPLCIVGLCLTGLSYGTSPTVSSAFTSAFYGQKHF